jgi:hypothetical protein
MEAKVHIMKAFRSKIQSQIKVETFWKVLPVWTSSKKTTDTKEGGRCNVVLPRYRVV